MSSGLIWHLALQWQNRADAVALLACTSPVKALSSFSHSFPCPLVVIKAWREDDGGGNAFERFGAARIDGWSQWYQMTSGIREFLKAEVKDETMILKAIVKSDIIDGKVIWRPLAPSKTELLEENKLPSYVKNAESLILHVLSEMNQPVRAAVLVEAGSQIFCRKTIYNALGKLKEKRLIGTGGWTDDDQGLWRLTKRGHEAAHKLIVYGSFKNSPSLSRGF